jgi:hypothetical protein
MQPILRMLITVMFFGGAAAIPLLYAGPQLYHDMRTASWTVAATLTTKASNCTRWSGIVTTCSIDYVDRLEPERVQPQLHYFVFRSWAGERGTLMKAADDPMHVTITLGIEHLADRTFAFAVWSAMVVGVIGLLSLLGLQTYRRQMAQENFRQR